MKNKWLVALCEKLGTTVLPDTTTHTHRFEVKSESSQRLYVVSKPKGAQADDSCVPGWACSCPAWITRRKCKHLHSIAPALKQIDTAEGRVRLGG